jgi:hypothetical protein
VRFHALEVVTHDAERFMWVFQKSIRLQRLMKRDRRRWVTTRPTVSRTTTYETPPPYVVGLSGLARFRGAVFKDPEFG